MSATITTLERDSTGWLLGFRSPDSSVFARTVAAVRNLPPHPRRYLPDDRLWWVDEWAIDDLYRVLPDLPSRMDACDRASRGGSGRGSDGFRAQGDRHQRTASGTVPAKVAAAFATLHLRESAPVELIAASRRVLARGTHPDHGGSHQLMVAINNAADTCEQWATTHANAGAA